eukprot:TRINITY_DN4077_c0_g1_i1.p1 TRINITY_DN4077_c0_g1~~TRINITY_DN4077_c0_g1_i1.p1  ORF type:complete len:1082 (+),score=349.09 TRINITY_DN4077_c0_g1_i1:120-3365(+)
MGYDTQGFFYSVAISAAVGIVFLFCARRVYTQDRVLGLNAWRVYRSMWPHARATAVNFGGWGKERARFKDAFLGGYDPWLEEVQGGEVRLYLMFLRLSACVFAFVGALCAAILIPVYATDSHNADFYWQKVYPEECCNGYGFLDEDYQPYEPGLADWTLTNVTEGSDRMWVVVAMAAVLTYEVCAMVTKLVCELRRTKSTAQMATAVVHGIGDSVQKAKRRLQKRLPRSLRQHVKSVSVPRAPPKGMLAAVEEMKKVTRELETLYAIMEKENIAEGDMMTDPKLMISAFKASGSHGRCQRFLHYISPTTWWSQVSGVKHYRQRADDLHEQLLSFKAEMLESGKLAGVAYITFSTPDACAQMVASAYDKKSRNKVCACLSRWFNKAVALTGGGEKVWFAPVVPNNVIWANAGDHRFLRLFGHWLVIAFLVFAALVWGIVVGYLGNLDNWPGVDMKEWGETPRELVTAYLPVAVASLLVLLFPFLLRELIQKVERVPDKIEREVRLCRYLTVFWLSVILFLQVFFQNEAVNTWDGLVTTLQELDARGVQELFVKILSPKSGYFVVVVITSGFITTPLRLCLFHVWLKGNFKMKLAVTKRDADEAYMRRPFFFSEEYPRALLIFGFAVLLSVTLPYMGIFAACYFYMKYLADRALLIDAYPRCRESTLRLVPVIIYSVLTLVLIMQLFGVVLLCIAKEHGPCSYTGAALFSFTAVFTFITHKHIQFLMGPEFLQGHSRPMLVLPNALGLIFGYDCLAAVDDTPFELVVSGMDSPSSPFGSSVNAPGSPGSPTSPGQPRGDIFADLDLEPSQYDNPLALVDPQKLDHEAMRTRPGGWQRTRRAPPSPNPHVVRDSSGDVFMENMTSDELHALIVRISSGAQDLPLMIKTDSEDVRRPLRTPPEAASRLTPGPMHLRGVTDELLGSARQHSLATSGAAPLSFSLKKKWFSAMSLDELVGPKAPPHLGSLVPSTQETEEDITSRMLSAPLLQYACSPEPPVLPPKSPPGPIPLQLPATRHARPPVSPLRHNSGGSKQFPTPGRTPGGKDRPQPAPVPGPKAATPSAAKPPPFPNTRASSLLHEYTIV